MTVIDFHNHYYPPEYIAALREGPSAYGVTTDEAGNPVLHSPGDYNVIVPGHRDIGPRTKHLDEAGVRMQVVSFTAPGTLIEEPAQSVRLSRLVNDALAKVVRDRADRYTALATLPLNDPKASALEYERVTGELGLPGVMVYSNANGIALADERFWPIYERASAAHGVIYIHPTYPVGVEAMTDYMLMPLLGFTFDTTLAAAKIVFAGVAERFPGIRWVLGHLGGTIPYLAERLDRGYEAYPECRVNIPHPPSEYLRRFYYDTVNFDLRCLELAIEFAGADHVLAGSDYPHMIGSLEKMVKSIDALAVSEAKRECIRWKNTAELLGLALG